MFFGQVKIRWSAIFTSSIFMFFEGSGFATNYCYMVVFNLLVILHQQIPKLDIIRKTIKGLR